MFSSFFLNFLPTYFLTDKFTSEKLLPGAKHELFPN